MKKGKLICIAGCTIDIDEHDLGFEELECPTCGCTNSVPETWDAVEEQNAGTREDVNERLAATHIRIMARGEDGREFCIKNMIRKDDPLLDLAMSGCERAYPEAKIWTEDEESTSAGYMNQLMRELL